MAARRGCAKHSEVACTTDRTGMTMGADVSATTGESSRARQTKRRKDEHADSELGTLQSKKTSKKKTSKKLSLGDAILQANNLTSRTKPADVEAMYKMLEEGLGECFPYGQDPLPCKISADYIHLAPDSLKYRVFVEKRKDQVQVEREALGVIRRKPELYCIPLRKRPVKGGGSDDDGPALILDRMPGRDEQWDLDDRRVPWWKMDVHWYIVGGQHTYQACVAIAAKEEPGSSRHKFFTEFDVIPVYSKDPDLLIKVSNVLNIQVKDKVVTENFRSQLKNARAKWIEKGSPAPKKAGAKHDAHFKELVKEFLSPFFGFRASTSTQKFPLCFLDDRTYEKWMEVFDAWEHGKLIMEDGRRPEGCIPKIPVRDITINDVDRTLGLRDSDMMKLAEAILANDVSIKSNKLADGRQREGTTLADWCKNRKRQRIVMNELMAEFRGMDLPSKKRDYVEYTDLEWEDLARDMNLTDETVHNIVTDVAQDKAGLEWLERRGAPLNPSQRGTDPAPSIYARAVYKYAQVQVSEQCGAAAVKFKAVVGGNLKEAFQSLPVIGQNSEPEVIVIFGYNSKGESHYLRSQDVITVNNRMVRNIEEPEKDSDDLNTIRSQRSLLLAPVLFICDSASSVNVQAFAASSHNHVWSAHPVLYLPSQERQFRKSVMDPRPVVHVSVCYNLVQDRREEFASFSEFTGIRKELNSYWDDNLKPASADWAGGKCNVALPLLQELLLPALKKFKCRVINFWGGGNVTALALGEGLPVLEFVQTAEDLHAAYDRVKGINFIPGGCSVSPAVQDPGTEAEIQSDSGESGDSLPSVPEDDQIQRQRPEELQADILHPFPTEGIRRESCISGGIGGSPIRGRPSQIQRGEHLQSELDLALEAALVHRDLTLVSGSNTLQRRLSPRGKERFDLAQSRSQSSREEPPAPAPDEVREPRKKRQRQSSSERAAFEPLPISTLPDEQRGELSPPPAKRRRGCQDIQEMETPAGVSAVAERALSIPREERQGGPVGWPSTTREGLCGLPSSHFTNEVVVGKQSTSNVASNPILDTYFLVLDMNGLLFEKKPPIKGQECAFLMREDVGEFLQFCLDNFEVVFWSVCIQKNLNSMIKALEKVCSPSCMERVRKCRMFDQDWCDPIVDTDGTPVVTGPHFFTKPLETLFQRPDGLKHTGASSENTLFIDDSPHKNVKNNIWNALHPPTFQSAQEHQGMAYFRHQLIPWLRRLKQSGQTVPRFCEANCGFGQGHLLPDGAESFSLLHRSRPGPKALSLL